MRSIFLLTIPVTLIFITSVADAASIYCPRSIAENPTVSAEDKEWIISSNLGQRQLEHVGIYIGTPSEYGAQAPDSTKTIKKKEMVTWQIRHSATETIWVGCSYIGTTAILFQKLDTSVTECVASYDLLPSRRRQRLSYMDCR